MLRHTALLLILCTLWGCSDTSDDQRLQNRIQRIENGLMPDLQIEGDSIPHYNVEERMRELGIPGVSIAVLNNGEIEWAKGYGWADVSEEREVNTGTFFQAASISKPVSAIRALQMAENGRIHLDTNVNSYLTSWKVPDNEFTKDEKVTTRRILNHTAGLTVWGFPGYKPDDTLPSVVDVLDGRGNTDSVRVYKAPGESWMYSGGGYTILQLMMTDLDQTPFPELMKEHVLGPLGMEESTYSNPLPERYRQQAATGYRENGEEVEGKWATYPEMGPAGLWTTPSELILWAREIQKIYQKKQPGILLAETVEEMLTPGMNDHGLGPTVDSLTFGHGGANEGFRSQLLAWKNVPNAVVVMVNSDNRKIIKEIMLSIANEYNLPGVEPKRRSINEIPPGLRKPFTGLYNIPRFGEVQIVIKDEGLEVTADFSNEPVFLLPESDSLFFESKSGNYFEFQFVGDSVAGFKYGNLEAQRIKDIK